MRKLGRSTQFHRNLACMRFMGFSKFQLDNEYENQAWLTVILKLSIRLSRGHRLQKHGLNCITHEPVGRFARFLSGKTKISGCLLGTFRYKSSHSRSNKSVTVKLVLTRLDVPQLINAKTTKSGFRVFRVKAVRLEFRLSNGSNTVIDSNSGRNYLVESPGRYVVESGHGCRRVGDANIADCLRAMRPSDKYIEIVYVGAKSWRNCFITFSAREESRADWFRDSMQMMRNGQWFRRLECGAGIVFAFNDGADRWDSNNGENYHLTLPGKYVAGNGKLTFCGISDFDMHMP